MLLSRFKKTLGIKDLVAFIQKDWSTSYVFIFCFMAIAICINYLFDLEDSYLDLHGNSPKGVLLFLSLNLIIYGVPLLALIQCKSIDTAIKNYQFWCVLLLALTFLSVYQSTNLINLWVPEWHTKSYYNWKLGSRLSSLIKYVSMFIILGVVVGRLKHHGFGFFNFSVNFKTYFSFLLVMLPLVIFASTQSDFLDSYPKLKQGHSTYEEYLSQLYVFEPLYLLDFIFVEWFFRGFMVLYFAKYLDKKSILLAALVYCSFHFGKPLLECVSSFFGGYLLGYIVYKTKSIWGGVIVHMGLALMMDAFAFIALTY